MKYILLMQFPLGSWKTDAMPFWPAEDQKRHLAFLKEWSAQLTEMAGDRAAAVRHHVAAAGKTASAPERDYLQAQAARLR